MERLEDTFRKVGSNPDAYISKNIPPFSCPPYTIAYTALKYVAPGVSLTLPKGWVQNSLVVASLEYGVYDKEVRMGPFEAADYAQLGQAILDLNGEGKIRPPLTPDKEASIKHLIKIVAG